MHDIEERTQRENQSTTGEIPKTSGCGFRNRGRPEVHSPAEQPGRGSVCGYQEELRVQLTAAAGRERREGRTGIGDTRVQFEALPSAKNEDEPGYDELSGKYSTIHKKSRPRTSLEGVKVISERILFRYFSIDLWKTQRKGCDLQDFTFSPDLSQPPLFLPVFLFVSC